MMPAWNSLASPAATAGYELQGSNSMYESLAYGNNGLTTEYKGFIFLLSGKNQLRQSLELMVLECVISKSVCVADLVFIFRVK